LLRKIKGFQILILKCKNNENALPVTVSVSEITNSITATGFEITNSVHTFLPQDNTKL